MEVLLLTILVSTALALTFSTLFFLYHKQNSESSHNRAGLIPFQDED